MSVEVHFPELSKNNPGAEGVLTTWFVDDDEYVKPGELIAEVQLDKVAADVEAPAAGILRHLVNELDVVRQCGTIARID